MTAPTAPDEAAATDSAARLAIPREARPFQGHRAGIVSRVLACSVDFGTVVLILVAAYAGWVAVLFLWRPTQFSFPSPDPVLVIVLGGVLLTAYLALAWTATGRSYGDHLMGLRVVNSRGHRLHFVSALVRAAFCTLFPVGLFWVVLSPRNRSVQDVVLRTSVIYDWQMRSHEST